MGCADMFPGCLGLRHSAGPFLGLRASPSACPASTAPPPGAPTSCLQHSSPHSAPACEQASGLGPHALPGLGGSPMDARSPFAAAAAVHPGQGGSVSSAGTSYTQLASVPSQPSMDLLNLPLVPLGSNPAALLQVGLSCHHGCATALLGARQRLAPEAALSCNSSAGAVTAVVEAQCRPRARP